MIIGLTGGTGSGKSYVASILSEYGYKIVDADAISREVVEAGSPALDLLCEYFSNDILNTDGSLNRSKLREKAFLSKENTDKLNEIVTSRIIEISKERLVGDCVYDAPTLFENNLEKLVDKILVVTADKEIRIERLLHREGMTREIAESIMAAQMPEEEKIDRADAVIYNNGDKDSLSIAVKDALNMLKYGVRSNE